MSMQGIPKRATCDLTLEYYRNEKFNVCLDFDNEDNIPEISLIVNLFSVVVASKKPVVSLHAYCIHPFVHVKQHQDILGWHRL